MGDIEGARSLIEEVEAESSGELRQQARRMLGQLALSGASDGGMRALHADA